eukprot:1337893-Amorphochlora_amoeboformis.AAC.1
MLTYYPPFSRLFLPFKSFFSAKIRIFALAKDTKGKPDRVVPPQSEGEEIREHEGEAREGDEIVENFEAEIDISDDAVLRYLPPTVQCTSMVTVGVRIRLRMVEHKGPVHCIAINSAATLALSGDQVKRRDA